MPAPDTLPTSIGRPATRALHAAGLHSLAQLATIPEADVARLHGVGPKALAMLRGALAENGRAFARGK